MPTAVLDIDVIIPLAKGLSTRPHSELALVKHGITTNLSKAFDCLPHDLIIAKLQTYGFEYLALKLVHSYSSGPKQRVPVNANFSE